MTERKNFQMDNQMTPLYTFTGPPCIGKTSIMNELKNVLQGNWFYIDEVTRHMKRKYDIGINEDGSEISELLLINRHISNAMYPVSKRKEAYDGIILNRCILDTYVFTEWGHDAGKIPDWILDYASRSLSLFIGKYDLIFYPDPYEVDLKGDGVRSDSNSFRKEITQIFESVIDRYEIPVVKLSGSNNERVDTFLDCIREDMTPHNTVFNDDPSYTIAGRYIKADELHESILKTYIDPLDDILQL